MNIGISLIDSCNRKMTTSKAKVSRAIDELKSALSLMEKLRKLAEKSGEEILRLGCDILFHAF